MPIHDLPSTFGSSGCTKFGLMKINLSCPAKLNLNCLTLHALGHTYFIIALQTPLNNIKYICDNAIHLHRETIWEYTKQIKNVTSYTIGYSTALLAAPQLEVECLAVIKEQWLSDIQTVSSSLNLLRSSQTLQNFVMVDKPLMAFALILKLMLFCVARAVLYFHECTIEEKFIATI